MRKFLTFGMRYLFTVFIISLFFACETVIEPEPIRVIPDQMKVFVDRFVLEAEKRGFFLDVSELSFEFEHPIDGGTTQNPIVGSCSRLERLKLIKIDTLNSLWLLSGHLGREEIIFHELGHCLLNREHIDDKFSSDDFVSIMRSVGQLQYGDINNFTSLFLNPTGWKAHKRDYYIEELFNENTSAPCWSDSNNSSPFPIEIFDDTFIEQIDFRGTWVDPDNNIWFYGKEKNYVFNGVSFIEQLPGIIISALSNDKAGNLWVAGVQNDVTVLGVFRSGVFQNMYQGKDLPSSLAEVDKLLIDDNNIVWVSNKQGALFADSGEGLEVIPMESEVRVSKMVKGPNKTVYMLKGALLYIFENPNDFVQVGKGNTDLPTDFFRTLEVDADGVAWLRVGGSAPFFLNLMPNLEVRRLEYYDINLAEIRVNAISTDGLGNIWIATSNGIKKWEGGSFSRYCTYNTGVPILNFHDIIVGENGNIWSIGNHLETSQFVLMLSKTGI